MVPEMILNLFSLVHRHPRCDLFAREIKNPGFERAVDRSNGEKDGLRCNGNHA